MPTTLEVKHEYLQGWPGRVKLGELIVGILALACCAPGFHSTQHWFLLVASIAFLGTLFFTAFYLFLDVNLRNYNVNWLQVEFWFTTAITFFYFTAFVAQLAEFAGLGSSTWVDLQVAAGVFGLFNDILYGIGAYFVYLEWKANPLGPGEALPPSV
uniref:CKLFlike MARVEL transmembrane domaincontaining protein 4like [Megachile rotundata] n=2 Tax=Lepeophtheirus salmonis TaxID=72036 RepID=A0A0K2UQH8_LEPSM